MAGKESGKTPWQRLIQPHSGSGKGFHFIPEIGEEVSVDLNLIILRNLL
ncbi:phage baseplate assembly protein V [Chryseobacterium sp. G0201]|nr:phage baseplate assembly protein V [Chryseobacterium sp. G0201]